MHLFGHGFDKGKNARRTKWNGCGYKAGNAIAISLKSRNMAAKGGYFDHSGNAAAA